MDLTPYDWELEETPEDGGLSAGALAYDAFMREQLWNQGFTAKEMGFVPDRPSRNGIHPTNPNLDAWS